MKCSFKRLIHAPPRIVWRIMTDMETAPDRFPQFEGWTITRDPRGADLIALSHDRINRGETEYIVRLTVHETDRMIAAEYLEANLEPIGKTVTYTVDPVDGGTGLDVVLDVQGLVGFIYMFFVVRQFIDRLKAVAEEDAA